VVDHDEYQRWTAEARSALRAARVQADAGLHNWACFAAEQAAQLGIKAVLHGIGAAPWGHDLIDLGRKMRDEVGEAWTNPNERLQRLSRHYIPARYPDAHASGPAGEHYGTADSEQAIADTEQILEATEAVWTTIIEAASHEPE